MDWRVWAKQKLDANVPLVAVVPASSIHGAGGQDVIPTERPFIELKLSGPFRGPFPGVSYSNLTVWVHDEPGDYMLIDSIIGLVKAAISGADREAQVGVEGAVCARWLGDSEELVDDGYHTIVRNTLFQLNGKET